MYHHISVNKIVIIIVIYKFGMNYVGLLGDAIHALPIQDEEENLK